MVACDSINSGNNALQVGREANQSHYGLAPALIQENCRHLSQVSLPSATTIQPAALWLAMRISTQ